MRVAMAVLDQIDPNWRREVCSRMQVTRLPAAIETEQQRVCRKARDRCKSLDEGTIRNIAKRKALNAMVRKLAVSGDYKRTGSYGQSGHATDGRVLLLSLMIAKSKPLT